jgi:hypothetical protein
MGNDIQILRELAKQTMEVANQELQNERRGLWSDFNSMKTRRVPVYILDPQGIWHELFGESALECENWLFRQYERWLRLQLYHASFGDDYIIEPWITAKPVYKNDGSQWESWGFSYEMERINETLAYRMKEPPVKTPGDLAKLVTGIGEIDIEATESKINILKEAVGDIIPVIPDMYPPKIANLASAISRLLGPQEIMYQIYDEPEMVHELCGRISAASLEICEKAETAGFFSNCDFTFLNNPQIQAMPYCHELPAPGAQKTVTMKEHWIYDCAQEFEGISPEMFDEYVVEYQKPIYERFGLTAFGCCENLEHKIKCLKRISNLRRIAVTPWADNERCAEQIENKYIISWRPNPAEMVAVDFDPERISLIIRHSKTVFDRYGCYWEINLKDFITVNHDKARLAKWVMVAREALEQ